MSWINNTIYSIQGWELWKIYNNRVPLGHCVESKSEFRKIYKMTTKIKPWPIMPILFSVSLVLLLLSSCSKWRRIDFYFLIHWTLTGWALKFNWWLIWNEKKNFRCGKCLCRCTCECEKFERIVTQERWLSMNDWRNPFTAIFNLWRIKCQILIKGWSMSTAVLHNVIAAKTVNLLSFFRSLLTSVCYDCADKSINSIA